MASEKFRHELRSESQQWRQDGWITADQQQQLADRYQFDRLDEQASGRFTLLLIVVGSVLVGLGIITYVAANWQDIPKVFRTLLLFGLFAIANLSGFYLHRKSDKLKQILGQGLLIIGGMTLGATMALMAQMYHISGPLHPLLLTWGFGVVLMAYCLRNAGLGILSVLILLWAGGVGSFELRGLNTPTSLSYQIIILNLGVITGLLYFPLAQWTRSRSLLVIAIIASQFNLLPAWYEIRYQSSQPTVTHLLSALLLILPIAFLWSYPKLKATTTHQTQDKFRPIARNFGILSLGLLLYICSFRQSFLLGVGTFPAPIAEAPKYWIYGIPGIIVLSLTTVFQWSKLMGQLKRLSKNEINSAIAIGAMLLIIGGYCFLGDMANRPELVFVMNALLAILGIGCIRESLETKRRSQFWYGLLVVVVQIATRFLEYDTELILKAIILVLCGFGIIAAGIWFEKYANRSRLIASSNSSGDPTL
jgi:uncharacterized membrane protein